jgi:hypothetical protein
MAEGGAGPHLTTRGTLAANTQTLSLISGASFAKGSNLSIWARTCSSDTEEGMFEGSRGLELAISTLLLRKNRGKVSRHSNYLYGSAHLWN